MSFLSRLMFLIFASAVFVDPASAHTGHGTSFGASFSSGFGHPFSGLDHLLAMFAVGLLAAQLGGRALSLVPSAFVFTMVAGAIAGLAGMPLPGVEYAIAISIVAIALPVALAFGMPVLLAMAYVAVFAFFHGHAHAAELPVGAVAAQYILGFAAGTAVIHALGIGVGLLAGKYAGRAQQFALRMTGSVVVLAGLALLAI